MRNVPKFTPMATIGVPTICMILLFLLPLYDRSPERLIERRPVALAAGLATIAAMAFLTYSGASTGSPNCGRPGPAVGPDRVRGGHLPAGEIVVGESGCLACHMIGDNGNNGPGPPLTHIGSISCPPGRSPRRCATRPRRCRRSRAWRSSHPTEVQRPGQLPLRAAVGPVRCRRRALTSRRKRDRATVSPGTLEEPQVRAMFDRIAGLYDRMNTVMTAGLHHQWRRRAAELAPCRPGDRALDVATGTGDLAFELARTRGAGRRGGRRRLLRADAGAGARQGRGAARSSRA